MINQLSAFAISFILLSNAAIAQDAEKVIWDDVQRIEFSDDERRISTATNQKEESKRSAVSAHC